MGKQGPCHHCGVTSTPLWRNGPPEKPVLCNACGSRWRTKGTLVNYTPLHARAEPDEFEDYRVQRVKTISLKNKDTKFLKRKQSYGNAVAGGIDPDYNQSSRKSLDEDTSNRSSSGSAISNSESCVQFGSADASDFTDPAQSVVWESMVPSKKRTCVLRTKPSPVEKLTKDLYTILHEQQQSSYFSGSSEEDLLFESDTPMVSVEIGHGSVLIRHPSSIARDEESEASSLSMDTKSHVAEEAYAHLTTFPVHKTKGANFAGLGTKKSKKLPAGYGMQNDQNKRDKAQHEILHVLGNHNSPLRYVDLKDVLDFEGFASLLSVEEQKQLLKYLPPIDSARLPDSLECMFASPQFKENLSSFQKLLAEGVLDLSFPERSTEECRTLKRLVLCNVTKSKWVEQYNQFKNRKHSSGGGPAVPGGSHSFASGSSASIKRFGDSRFQNGPGPNVRMKCPKAVMKGGYEQKELIDNDGSCFSPRSLFALPPDDSSSLVLDSFQFAEEGNSDQDLLLDVPSNSYFPQAELLSATKFHPPGRH